MFSKRRFVNVGDVEDIFEKLSDWRHKVDVTVLTPEEMQIHQAHLAAIEVVIIQAVNHRKKSIEKYTDEYIYTTAQIIFVYATEPFRSLINSLPGTFAPIMCILFFKIFC